MKAENSNWIDISLPLHDNMVSWPGDPPVRIEKVQDVERGDSHTLSSLSIGSHTGTHIDAPAHFLKGGMTVDRIPLDKFSGRARVLEIQDKELITVPELAQYKISQGERVLLKTNNSTLWKSDKFAETFVYISPEAAQYLAECRVGLIGVDYLSVGGYKAGGLAQHKTLLQANVCIVEGLNLSAVSPGVYDLICLPLRIQNGDGAPARAIIRPISDES